jgi:tRNA threonylcarbamoyladenosine modification (KEOPS) complex  Pcc1 subunit
LGLNRIEKPLKADIVIPFDSTKSLQAIHQAIVVDQKHQPNKKALVSTKVQKRELKIHISADDIPSLRATLNSNLRVLLAWKNIAEGIKKRIIVNRNC